MFPAIVDTVMLALRYSLPNPYQATDPATNLTCTIYNAGRTFATALGLKQRPTSVGSGTTRLSSAVLGNHQRLMLGHHFAAAPVTMVSTEPLHARDHPAR